MDLNEQFGGLVQRWMDFIGVGLILVGPDADPGEEISSRFAADPELKSWYEFNPNSPFASRLYLYAPRITDAADFVKEIVAGAVSGGGLYPVCGRRYTAVIGNYINDMLENHNPEGRRLRNASLPVRGAYVEKAFVADMSGRLDGGDVMKRKYGWRAFRGEYVNQVKRETLESLLAGTGMTVSEYYSVLAAAETEYVSSPTFVFMESDGTKKAPESKSSLKHLWEQSEGPEEIGFGNDGVSAGSGAKIRTNFKNPIFSSENVIFRSFTPPSVRKRADALTPENTSRYDAPEDSVKLFAVPAEAGLDNGNTTMGQDNNITGVFIKEDERVQGDVLVSRLVEMGVDVRMDKEKMKQILAAGEYYAKKNPYDGQGLPERDVEAEGGPCRLLWYSNWDVYGLVQGGTIYLDPDRIKAETPIHEYTHLMTEVVRRKDPALWNRIVSMLRNNPVWGEIRNNTAYASIHGNEDEMADEVLATISGRRGSELLSQMREDYCAAHPSASVREAAEAAVSSAAAAVSRFWNGTADLFGYERSENADDLADTALAYLLGGVNPKTILSVRDGVQRAREEARRGDSLSRKFKDAGFPAAAADNPGRDLSYFGDAETQGYLENISLYLNYGVKRSAAAYLFGRREPPAEIVGFEQDASGVIILHYHEQGDRHRRLRSIPLNEADLCPNDKPLLENWLFHSLDPSPDKIGSGHEGAVQYALAERMRRGLDPGMPTGVILERHENGKIEVVPVGLRKGTRGDEIRPIDKDEMREFISRATSVGGGGAWKALVSDSESRRNPALKSPLALVKKRIESSLTKEYDRLFPGVSKVEFEIEKTGEWGMVTKEKVGFGAMMLLLSAEESAGLQAQVAHSGIAAERIINSLYRAGIEGNLIMNVGGKPVRVPSPPQQLVASLTLRAIQGALEQRRTEVERAKDELQTKMQGEDDAEKHTELEDGMTTLQLCAAQLACAADAIDEFFRTHSAPYDPPTKEQVREFVVCDLLGRSLKEKPVNRRQTEVWGDDEIPKQKYVEPVCGLLSNRIVAGESLAKILDQAGNSLAWGAQSVLNVNVNGCLAISDGKMEKKDPSVVRRKEASDGTKKGYRTGGYGNKYGNKNNGARSNYSKFAPSTDKGEPSRHK